jgi:hypothetical protein
MYLKYLIVMTFVAIVIAAFIVFQREVLLPQTLNEMKKDLPNFQNDSGTKNNKVMELEIQ